jgi:hypothetical protein
MRYMKGTLRFSESRDIPLLKRVLNSRFVTHSQLYSFMRLSCLEWDRQVFNWRVRRLIRHGLVQKRAVTFVAAETVYSIGNPGVLALETYGGLPFAAWTTNERIHSETHIPHCLELNNIELAMHRTGVQFDWVPETQLRCLCNYIPNHFAKVYDAVVSADLGGGRVKFALEYEATQKTFARYEKIRQAIESEGKVDCFLYLVTSFELLRAIREQFRGTRRRIWFALVRDFKERVWDTMVFGEDWRHHTVREVLVTAALMNSGSAAGS